MKSISFVGDIHCHTEFKQLMEPGSIQLGDLCVLEYKNKFDFGDGQVRYFVDGNHDFFPALDTSAAAPAEVAKGLVYLPRGYMSGRTMFVGGAFSIDKALRVPGLDWFPEETVSLRQAHNILSTSAAVECIVSHDCPTVVLQYLNLFCHTDQSSCYNQKFMQLVLSKFSPKLWIFAHYHQNLDVSINGCRFVCINSCESRRFDVPVEKEF